VSLNCLAKAKIPRTASWRLSRLQFEAKPPWKTLSLSMMRCILIQLCIRACRSLRLTERWRWRPKRLASKLSR